VYVDSFSTTNTSQQVSLHKAYGEQLTWFCENAITENHPLKPYQANWVKPTIASFSLDDGTELYYSLYKPHNIQGKH
jgi:dipeptidyl-peptidase-4